MNNIPKIGVFLCKCGEKIEPLIDLSALEKDLNKEPDITHCEILPYSCLLPGLNHIISKIQEKKLTRIIVAGCESRLILKKFEKSLKAEGLGKGQIDVINLRGHVANVSDLSPELKAEKGAKLIKAAVAGMISLNPIIQTKIQVDSPPIIVGGGVASFSAAKELSLQGIDCLLSLPEIDTDLILKNIYKHFPGERYHAIRLKKIIEEVKNSPHVKLIPYSEPCNLSGITGDYTISFSVPGESANVKYKTGAVIICMDEDLLPPGPEFGYDGKTVLCQTEFEDMVWNKEISTGQMVFWINDYEAGQKEFARLSARSAWIMGKYIIEHSHDAKVVIMFNEQMSIPLSASERAIGRKLGLNWIPYDKSVEPVLQANYINFGSVNDHLEHELQWDRLVLSPIRKISQKTIDFTKTLGILHGENESLDMHHVRVRPEMVGREETCIAGTVRYFCDLSEALSHGRTIGKKNAEMLKKSRDGQLYSPGLVCVVDADKCVGCGQCQELCDFHAIGVIEGTGGGLPRIVDAMLCTGGGTCAAACPYQALTLQNNTSGQQEAIVTSLSRQIVDDEFVAFACSWAGLPAADNVGNMGLKYDPKAHIIGVRCVGQIDISVMASAFLEGAPGVLLIGCPPEDCHHSFGVDHAWSRVNLIKKLFSLCGFDRRRIALSHADMNKPEEFIRTVENFSRTIATLGPMEKNSENQNKLQSIYRLVKYNSRIRLLLSAGLRRAWESTYRGNQLHALEYDRSDFMDALKEEFLKTRLEEIFITEKRQFNINELSNIIPEKQSYIMEQLGELDSDGIINHTYKDGNLYYMYGK